MSERVSTSSLPTAGSPLLGDRIPERGFADADEALEAFLGWVGERGIELYDAQEEAILELLSGKHVILKTPTGSGKSLVATALHFWAFSRARRSVYTAPIKALVSEKFFSLCELFGAEFCGMMTGDGTVNPDAPIVCCTAEILEKLALRHQEETPFAAVVMDEFHYYGDRDRGMAWQVPLLTMPKAQFLLMSATLGITRAIEEDLAERTGVEVAVVASAHRPVPLEFRYSELDVFGTLQSLVRGGRAPVYAVNFTQRDAAELAQSLLSVELCTPEEKAALKDAIKGFRFDSPYGPTLRRTLLHGVGIHHAGLLPKYRLLVEKLSQRGLFKVISGTDTLGVGINVPIRTVLFTQLCKYDGDEVRILTVRDFKQIAGRAGRKGYDDQGLVVAQAPAHIIENKRLEAAVADGKRNKKKFVRKQPPTRGYKHWDEETFQQLVARPPEELVSRFKVDHGLLLALLKRADERGGDGMQAVRELIGRAHVGQRAAARLTQEADTLLGELIAAGVVARTEDPEHPYRVAEGLQDDFDLFHSLSLFLLHALARLDPAAPDLALQIVSLVEAILEHPRPVLLAQVNREKGRIIADLKARGVPYEERLELLEEVTWPRPLAEFLYATFDAYRATRPWLSEDHIRPKSVAREMIETFAAFSNVVKELQLERVEGVLLRYLTQVYKTLVKNVPEEAHTEELVDAIAYLRALLARVDDSLLTSWETLMEGGRVREEPRPVDISQDRRLFRARIRAELHALVAALAREDYEEAAAGVRQVEGEAFGPEELERAMAPFVEEHGAPAFDGRARQAWNTQLEAEGPHRWRVRQILVPREVPDLEEFASDDGPESAWAIEGVVDLTGNTDPEGPIVQVLGVSI